MGRPGRMCPLASVRGLLALTVPVLDEQGHRGCGGQLARGVGLRWPLEITCLPWLGMVGPWEGEMSGPVWVLWLAGWGGRQPVGRAHASGSRWGSPCCWEGLCSPHRCPMTGGQRHQRASKNPT